MHMYFWFGTKVENFLFHGYNIEDPWSLISTCLGLSALAILFEAMKIFQIKLHSITKEKKQVPNPVPNTDSSSLISRASEKSVFTANSIKCYSQTKWFLEVLHFCTHVTLGYFLMLAVMTYNGYISIAIVLGSGLGYYVFGSILLEFKMSEFQKQHKIIQCNPECADAPVNIERRNSETSMGSEHFEAQVNLNVDVDFHAKGDI